MWFRRPSHLFLVARSSGIIDPTKNIQVSLPFKFVCRGWFNTVHPNLGCFNPLSIFNTEKLVIFQSLLESDKRNSLSSVVWHCPGNLFDPGLLEKFNQGVDTITAALHNMSYLTLTLSHVRQTRLPTPAQRSSAGWSLFTVKYYICISSVTCNRPLII